MFLGSFKDTHMTSSIVEKDPLFEAITSSSGISPSTPLQFFDGGKRITITKATVDPEKDLERLHTLTAEVWDDSQEEAQEIQ